MADTAGAASNAAAGAAAGSALGPWGAVAGGAIGALGSIFGSKKSSKSAAKIAAMQLAWEREKAQNSIQWGVQDAIKAGINPAVAVNTNSNAGSINPPMPDTKGYSSAGQMLNQGITNAIESKNANSQQKLADTGGVKNMAQALEAEVSAGLKPRETAVKEMDAVTNRLAQENRAREIDATVDRINKLLPGEMQGQAYELAVKAANARLTKREIDTLDNTGLTLDEWKGLGNNILGVVKDVGRLKYGSQLLNATKPTRITHDYYNGMGELTGFRVDKNYY